MAHLRSLLFLVFMYGMSNGLFSQYDYSSAFSHLNVNNLRVQINNNGDDFWNRSDAQFLAPYNGKNSISSLYAQNLWIAAKGENGNVLQFIDTYRSAPDGFGFLPGPVTDYEFELSTRNWNKIFEVYQFDIIRHLEDFEDNGIIDDPIPSIFGWPAKGNSFFYQYNGFDLPNADDQWASFHESPGHINGIYEPQFGEFPLPEGLTTDQLPAQIIYCVYNSRINSTGFDQPSLDVHQTSYAFSCSDTLLNNSVFINYRIVNRSSHALKDFRLGLFIDADLGGFGDDCFGSHEQLQTAYVYNCDNNDHPIGNNQGYGNNPPVLTITQLDSKAKMSSIMSMNYKKTSVFAPNAHLRLYGQWDDGTPLTQGGNGYNPGSTDSVNYIFNALPSEINKWSMFQQNIFDIDERLVLSTQSNSRHEQPLGIDSSFSATFGYTYFRKEGANHVQNVDYAISRIKNLHSFFENPNSTCQKTTCDCLCKWSGDTNLDGLVDYTDIINIFRGFGLSGPKSDHHVSWHPQTPSTWPVQLPSGANAGYADISNDGRIDSVDIQYLADFIGLRNACYSIPKRNCSHSDEFYWSLQNHNDTIFGQSSLTRATLHIRDSTKVFEGISFEIHYDPFLISSVQFQPKMEWKDEKNNWTYSIKNETEGIIKVVIFNQQKNDLELAHSKVLNMQLLGTAPPKSYHQSHVEYEICNGVKYYSNGSEEKISSFPLKLRLPDSTLITTVNRRSRISLKVWPNPLIDYVNVQGIMDHAEFQIFNVNGVLCQKGLLTSNISRIEFQNAIPGVYILVIKSKEGFFSERLVIQG